MVIQYRMAKSFEEDEPWFSRSSGGGGSTSAYSSSRSHRVWPRWPRPIFEDDQVHSSSSSRSSPLSSSSAFSSSSRRYSGGPHWFYRALQLLTLAFCLFGLYSLVANGVSVFLARKFELSPSNGLDPSFLIPNETLREQLKSWLFDHSIQKYRAEGLLAASDDPIDLVPYTSSSSSSFPSNGDPPIFLDLRNFGFLLNNASICPEKETNSSTNDTSSTPMDTPGSGVYFMIVVHSAPSHFAERQAIRSTWGSVKTLKGWAIRIVFILGSSTSGESGAPHNNQAHESNSKLAKRVARESEIFGDIALADFVDTYRNLTFKHLMGYKWVKDYCPGATFVLKTDDDAFIDIFQLFEFTTSMYGFSPTDTLICNVFPEGTKPLRSGGLEGEDQEDQNEKKAILEVGKKWIVSTEEYPHQIYPKYCGGLAYLITPDLVERVLGISHNSRFFWIDDVYVTGILREVVEIREPFYLNLRYSYEAEEYRKWLADRRPKKIPFMIVHVERGLKFTSEMNHLWRKTMKVWS